MSINDSITLLIAEPEIKMSEIDSYLYLGNMSDANDMSELIKKGITHIINVTDDIECFYQAAPNNPFRYLRVPVKDRLGENLRVYFEETNKFIDNAKNDNGKVLVHCKKGISRSTTIVMAYLLKKNKDENTKLEPQEILDKLQEKRRIATPKANFIYQLYLYNIELNGSNNKINSEKINT